MKDDVQVHVNVPRALWKAIKQAALDRGDTLGGVVTKMLEKSFGSSVAKDVPPKENMKGGRV